METEILTAACAAVAMSFLIYRLLLTPPSFSTNDIPDLTGKTAIITGANSGLGLASAKAMAAKGCKIVLACRSEDKANAAIAEIKQSVPDADLVFMRLNLADWDSVKSFTEQYKKSKLPIHILMNNAGIMAPPLFEMSKHAVELQMAGNHLGHFYLTLLLMPIIEKTANADKNGAVRIVNLSSVAHWGTYWRGIDFSNINNPRTYNAWLAYGQSKLANLLFSNQLQKRIEGRLGLQNVFVNAVHPGGVATNLAVGSAYIRHLYNATFASFFILTSEQGSLTQLYCATSEEIPRRGLKARYFVPTATLATPSWHGRDERLAEELWDWSVATLEKKGFSVPSV